MTQLKNQIRILLILIYFAYSISANAQDQTVAQQRLFMDKQLVIPPSAEPSTLGQYGEYEVNAYTGAPSISVPVYTMKGNELAVNVGLSYNAQGNKVGTYPGWVGLGWSLSAGGVISRSVKAEPDLKHNYYDKADEIMSHVQTSSDLLDEYQFMYQVAGAEIETQPDDFYYSFNGRSGNFYISPEQEIIQREYNDILIEPIYSDRPGFYGQEMDIVAFVITDESGTKYRYEDAEITRLNYDRILNPQTIDRKVFEYEYRSAWYLTSIISKNGNERVTFEYDALDVGYELPINPEQYKSRSFRQCDCDDADNPGTTTVGGPPNLSQVLDKRYLRKIDCFLGNTLVETLRFNTGDVTCPHSLDTDEQLDNIELSRLGGPKLIDWDFGYDCSTGRLTLKSLQQSGGLDAIEPYTFDYNDRALPGFFSTAIDHWGFLNGVSGLIPEYDFDTGVYNESKREPDEDDMKAGILEKITYPTKGSTEFEFESHVTTIQTSVNQLVPVKNGRFNTFELATCNELLGNCCDDPNGPPPLDGVEHLRRVDKTLLIEEAIKTNAFLSIRGRYVCDPADVIDPEPVVAYDIEVFDLDDNSIGIHSYISPPGEVLYLETINLEDEFGINEAGCYRVEVSGYGTQVNVLLETRATIPITKEILQGGLRVNNIKSFDSDGSLLLHKGYKYTTEGSSQSSGKVLRDPSYLQIGSFTNFPVNKFGGTSPSECAEYSCETLTLGTSSITELGAVQGSLVGYSRVEEIIYNDNTTDNDEGKTVSHFFNEGYGQDRLQIDPTLDGQLLKKEVFDTGGRLLHDISYEYSFNEEDNHKRQKLFYGYVVKPSSAQDNQMFLYQDDNGFYIWTEEPNDIFNKEHYVFPTKLTRESMDYDIFEEFYIHPTRQIETYYYYDNAGNEINNISTEKLLKYESLEHLQMTEESIINSNGKNYVTEYKYPQDQSGGVIDLLKDRHIVTSIESFKKVDGVLVDGSKTDWLSFGGHLYPHRMSRYEVTWDENGTYVPAVLTPLMTISDYNVVVGKPVSVTQFGWRDPAIYQWTSSGKLAKASFINFDNEYEYNPTNQLSKVTQVDETEMTYQYDGLLRLKNVIDQCRQSSTDISYVYKSATSPDNFIQTIQSYPQFGEELQRQDISSKVIFDGIGRQIQSIQLNQAPNPSEHIIVSTVYDGIGRPFRQYEPTTSTSADYNTPSGFYTETAYEPSPLNRTISVTPPNWPYPTLTEYGANNATEVLRDIGAATYYDLGLLHQVRTIDPNGNISEVFTDRVGREILVRRSDDQGGQDNDTYKLYDDKDRVTTIVPPGASLTDQDLLFKYVYLEDDLIRKKDMPDSEPEFYAYNSRHLMSYRQDGNMRDDSRTYATTYDPYGRVLQEGFRDVNFGDIDLVALVQEPNLGNGLTYVTADIDNDLITNIYVDESARHKDKLQSTSSRVLLDQAVSIGMTYTYDACGRAVKEEGNAIITPDDLTSHQMAFQYDAADNVIKSIDLVPNLDTSVAITNLMQYDHIGRLTGESIQIGNYAPIQLSSMSYTAKEQLLQVIQGGQSNPLQTCDYTYLDNRFLKTMNDPNDRGGDLFAMELFYDQQNALQGAPDVRRNGDIIAQHWSTAADPNKAVGYGYDYLNRLTSSDYNIDGRYNTTHDYDPRGNITKLTRSGGIEDNGTLSYGAIDDLDFATLPGTNQLTRITDMTTKSNGFKAARGTDYAYDRNGNMIDDPGNGVLIEYSHLDLPDSISVPDSNGLIKYFYTADGALQRKETIYLSDSDTLSRQYISAYEYLNDTLYQINTSQGYILLNPDSLESVASDPEELDIVYKGDAACLLCVPTMQPDPDLEVLPDSTAMIFYVIKDHLGNSRVIYEDSSGVAVLRSEHHYYPFGLEMNGEWNANSSTDYNYTYNGKEVQRELGLGYLRFENRYYDPTIGRFTGVDPIAEDYSNLSTFNYAGNSPVTNIDLWGLQPVFAADGTLTGYQVQAGQGPTQIAEDLNENYDCFLQCEVTFTDIVNDNTEAFANVIEGDGEANDKYNEDFKSGNIEEGDVLEITQGHDVTEETALLQETNEEIADLKEDSAHKTQVWMLDAKLSSREAPGDPKTGPRLGAAIKNYILHERPYNKTIKKLRGAESKRDSLKGVINDKTNSARINEVKTPLKG